MIWYREVVPGFIFIPRFSVINIIFHESLSFWPSRILPLNFKFSELNFQSSELLKNFLKSWTCFFLSYYQWKQELRTSKFVELIFKISFTIAFIAPNVVLILLLNLLVYRMSILIFSLFYLMVLKGQTWVEQSRKMKRKTRKGGGSWRGKWGGRWCTAPIDSSHGLLCC